MPAKRFRTARYWHNALLMIWATPFIVLPGVIVAASSGNFDLLWISITVVFGVIVVAAARDRRKSFIYELDDVRLLISGGGEDHSFAMAEIADASLVDRSAAREYLRQRIQTRGAEADAPAMEEEFSRFCSVDIGLTSFTLGLGRALIDRMPNAKNDLVLIRLGSGKALMLSPTHAQAFIESLNRRKLM
jgi:hypothetical protein